MMEARVNRNTKLRILKVMAFLVVFLMVGVSFNAVIVEADGTQNDNLDDDGLSVAQEETNNKSYTKSFDKLTEAKSLEPPSGPSLNITNTTTVSVSMKWNIILNADYYELYRKKEGLENFSKIDNISNNNMTETGLIPYKDEQRESDNYYIEHDTQYTYYVKAINIKGSAKSNEESVVTDKQGGISNLTISDVTHDGLVLKWDGELEADDHTDKYVIYRKKEDNEFQCIKDDWSISRYTDYDLEPNTYYEYYVEKHVNETCFNTTHKCNTTTNELPPLPGPVDLEGTMVEDLKVQLEWNYISGAEEYYYRVYSRIKYENDFGILVDGIESESYTTGGLKEGKTYEFYVTIYDPDTDREGPMSNIVSITTDSEWPGPGDPPGVETTMDSENDDGSINMESGTDGDPINEETVTGSNFIKQVWDTDKLDYIGATSRIKAMVSIKSEEDPFDIKLSLKYLDNDDWKTVSEETAEIDADFDYEKVIKDFTLTSDSYYNNDRYRNKKWRLVIDNAGEIEKEFEIENIPEIKITKCSDPYDPDTDSDGLDDNEELLEGTEILNPDTDGDTLSDGLEVNGWTSIVDGESERFTSNPLKNIDLDGDGYNDVEEYNYGTDPHNSDTDEDGLEDDVEIEGWHIRYKANYDFGIQGSDDDNMMKVESSPLWTDTDNDGLDDLQEYTNGTHPANSDSDWDGLDDLQEIENYGTNPVDYDTDGDGVYDEIECTDSGEVKYLGEIISNEGLDPDTDNDGIIDGKEKYGYNITYFTGLGNNTEKNRTINNSDPLTAYKYDNGTWIDTDRDGIIDAIEQNYSLVMDSIFDDVEGINDTRMFYMYHVSQGNEEILQLHFNPYITDMMKPYSLEFKVRNDFNGGDPEGDVEMRIFDSSGIDYVKITNEDQDNSKIIDGSELHNEGEFYVLYESIDIDGSDDYWLDGWDIRVKVVDENGNSYKLERHVKSETVQGWQYFTDWLIGYLQEEVDRTMEMIGEVTQILADSLKYNLRSLSKLPLMEEVRMSAQTIRAIRRNSMSNYFELFPFPTYYQGSYGLCAALCCKMVPRYYGHDATIEEINKTAGVGDVYDGMSHREVLKYLNKTGFYEDDIEKKNFSNTFNTIATQIGEQKDPIIVHGLDDLYEVIGISSDESHDVVIVGYYENDGEKGVVIADSNIALTGYTYTVSWDYLSNHLRDDDDGIILTEGDGMAV